MFKHCKCVSIPLFSEVEAWDRKKEKGGKILQDVHRLGCQNQQENSHLLAGVRHLTADSAQVLEAVPDGVDVGHAHEHDFTVWVIL